MPREARHGRIATQRDNLLTDVSASHHPLSGWNCLFRLHNGEVGEAVSKEQKRAHNCPF